MGEKLESRVFVVEDMRRMRSLLSELFSSLGDLRIVGTASTEAEADLWIDEHPHGWDLAVIDLLLEQGSGMGVVTRCRARHPDGKVVVLSSYATPGVRKHCLALGADQVFHKGQSADFVAFCAALAGRGAQSEPQA
jgi:DNA-binding NarL/FixJ family response regulator